MPKTPPLVGTESTSRKRSPSGAEATPIALRLMPEERAKVVAAAHARGVTLAALSRECVLVGLKKLTAAKRHPRPKAATANAEA